ncbi:MAG: hypothetical protein GX541_04820 [Clostridiales bacterium]|nr:hypothetical protein [Clostridiales bacterium]
MKKTVFPTILAALFIFLSVSCNAKPAGNSPIAGTGAYVGRADSNFIEIKVDGAPSDNPFVVFMLSDELKEMFETNEPESGANVYFEYTKNAHGQNLLSRLDVMS